MNPKLEKQLLKNNKKFLEYQIKFFEGFYLRHLKNPKLTKQSQEILKSLRDEYAKDYNRKRSPKSGRNIYWGSRRPKDTDR